MADERIRVEVDGDADALRRELRRSAAEVKAYSRSVQQDNRRAASSVDTDNRRITSSYGGLSKAIGDANRGFQLQSNIVKLVKPAALITGLGLATQAMHAAAAGGTALAVSMQDLIGLAPAAAQGYLAVGQAAGVVKLATQGLDDALTAAQEAAAGGTKEAKKYREELEKLNPEQRKFVEAVASGIPMLDKLRRSASVGLGDAAEGFRAAAGNFDVVNRIVRETSESLGRLAERAGRQLGTQAFGEDLALVGERNIRIIDRAGRATLDLADAARHLIVEAGPLTNWLSVQAARLAHLVDQEIRAKRESGELAEFFDRAREKTARLFSIVQSLAAGLNEVRKAATPLGDALLGGIDRSAQRWEDWTKSVRGQNALRDYFTRAQPTIEEAGRLVHDLTIDFFKMGNTPATTMLLRQLRTELLPVLFQVVQSTTAAFGPHLIDALTKVAVLFGHLAGSSGPLTAFVDAVGAAATAMTMLLDTVPGLNTAIVTLAAGVGIYKALKVGAAVTGMTTLVGLIRKAKTEQVGLAVAGGVSGAAPAAGAAAGAARGAAARGAAARVAGGGVLAAGAGVAGGPAGIAAMTAAIAGYALAQENLAKRTKNADRITREFIETSRRGFGALAIDTGRPSRQWDLLTRAVDKYRHRQNMSQAEFAAWREAMTQTGAHGRKSVDAVVQAVEQVNKRVRISRTLWREGITVDMNSEVTQRGADDIAKALAGLRSTTGRSMTQIRTDIRMNMRLIARTMDTQSAEGKEALAANFRAGVAAINRAMKDGQVSAEKGSREIKKLMERELALFGITGARARDYLENRGKEAPLGPHDVRGANRGLMTLPGQAGPDSIPMMLNGVPVIAAPGEDVAVINRHQRAVLDQRLSDMGGLPGLFGAVNRQHMQPMQAGGIVALGRRLQAQGYSVGENPAFGGVSPVHVKGSLHYSGQALDINADGWPGGEDAALSRLAAQLKAQGWHVLWHVPDHFDHLHVDTAGGAGGVAGVGREARIKRVIAEGVGGVVKGEVQAGLDSLRAAAQARLDEATAVTMSEPGEVSMTGGPWEQALAREARARGWSAADWRWIIARESGGRTNAKNPTSTAFGLGQLLDSTYARYGGGPGSSGAEQVHAMARYIADRYGTPTRAKAFWTSHNWYGRGGMIGAGRGLLHAARGVLIKKAKSPKTPKKTAGKHKKTQRPKPGVQLMPESQYLTPSGRRFEQLADRVQLREGDYGYQEQLASAVDEPITRTVQFPVGDIGGLLASISDAGERAWVGGAQARLVEINAKAGPDGQQQLDAELRDEGGIAARIGELTGLQALKEDIARLIGEQAQAAKAAISELAAGVTLRAVEYEVIKKELAERIAALKRATARIEHNNAVIARRTAERKKLADENERLRRGKTTSTEKAAISRNLARMREIDDERSDRRAENRDLARTVAYSEERQGIIELRMGVLEGELGAWRGQYAEVSGALGETLPRAVATIANLEIPALQRQVAELGRTPEKPTLPELPAVAATGEADAERQRQINELLTEQLRERSAQQFRAGLETSVLTRFAQTLGLRFVGAFARGGRIPETGFALVHKDERVAPDPAGPYGSMLAQDSRGPLQVELTVRLDDGGLLRIVDSRVNGQAARVTSRRQGRTARMIAAAPGA